ncbi:MAG: class B sortase [Clostridiales Family XIII bacterium]|jgi:sortase B|nr:class B sortase [Clostridiales Family XIII bacterium]
MRRFFLATSLILTCAVLLVCVGRLSSEYEDRAAADDQRRVKPAVPVFGASADIAADEESLPAIDFSGLLAENGEIVAWLTVDDTNIDYPVTQAADNRYYLTHTAKNKYSKQGSVFLEFRNNPDFSDFNNVLYAHNLKSGRMFGQLVKFKDKDFFDRHRTGTLYTPNRTFRLTFFSCAVTDPVSEYYRCAFASPGDRAEHMRMLKDRALNWREIPVDADTDRLLVLSTCSYEYKDARTVVIAKAA